MLSDLHSELFNLILITALLLGSPGPAPLALAATGAQFGFNRSIPFFSGIICGLIFVSVAAVFGITTVFDVHPTVFKLAKIVGGLYIVFIAYKIALGGTNNDENIQSPPSFLQGFTLNIINPKAYAALFAILSQYNVDLSDNRLLSYLFSALFCILVAIIVDLVWLYFGSVLREFFDHPSSAKVIRYFFALALTAMALSSLIL